MTTPEQEAKWLPVAQQFLDRWNIKHESLKGMIAAEIAGIVDEERERCAKIADNTASQLRAGGAINACRSIAAAIRR